MTVKRLMDVTGAVLGLTLAAPLMLVTALVVGFTLGRPIFIRQPRPGLHGRPFRMIKFRTMTEARDAEGRLLPDSARLGRVGKALRASSLDELPELWNVLLGEMSLVGPRPLLMEYLPLYSASQRRRHDVRPGMTGWAQVNGRNAISWEEKFELDVWYVDHRTLMLDLRILAMTVHRVFSSNGISQRGHATAEKFRGSNG
jgi:lipopolysaccharide/colanic/teichoic acid biosynthesis glycosyltransferase